MKGGEEFPILHFAVDTGYRDGRKPDCRQCRSVEVRATRNGSATGNLHRYRPFQEKRT